MMKALCVLGALLLIGGCASAPPAARGPWQPVEPDPLARLAAERHVLLAGTQPDDGPKLRALLALAEQQWRQWGGQRVTVDTDGRECAIAAADRCEPVDDGCGREQMSAYCGLVDGFWSDLRRSTGDARFAHDCSRTDVCTAHWPGLGRPVATPAWSAAFISALFMQAGYDAAAFEPSPFHADYVVAARDGRSTAFDVVPTPATVAPGDLICVARSTRREPDAPADPAEIRASTATEGPSPMHCDLVVAVEPSRHRAYAIGGNVMQAVSLVDVPLDAQDEVDAALQPAMPWLLVMRMRAAARGW